ncbi:murein biosynthesis integral membrane protein MurJ [Patescibacteria group bacterium]|nr:murein biosynthesis integral membrane protein MurJ [Patescibacteria group bacterium]
MWSKIWRKLTTTLTGGAIIIATASIVSRLLGLVRDRLLASQFGAGDELDIYYAAFRIPDLVFNVLVLGALSAAFIPVFIQYIQKAKDNPDNKNEVWHLANSLMNILLAGLLIFGAIFFVFAPYIIPLIAPGFGPEKQAITVNMTRIMLVAIIFFGLSNVITGILNSFKRYVNFAFAPVMYNIGIIIGIIALAPIYGLYGLAYGVVLGSFLHLAIQVPGALRLGFRYKPVFDYKHKGVRSIGKLMLPRTFGLAVSQIDQLVSVIIGSTLASGSVAVFTLANNLQSFPISVFGVSMAVASFPFLSEAFAQKNNDLFVQHFSRSFRRILFITIPVSVLILLLRAQIVRVILGTGAFDWDDTYLTAQALGLFTLSLFAQSTIPLLARSFYALKDTKTPVKTGIVSVILNISGALILTRYMGVLGLPLAFTIAGFFNMIILLVLLRKKMGSFDDKKIVFSVGKILLISAMMGIIVIGAKYLLAQGVNMRSFVGIFIQGFGAGMIGVASYLIFALLFRCDEIRIIYEWLKKAKHQLFNNKNNHTS